MVIVDSTVWIDFIAGRSNPESLWLRREIDNRTIGLTDLIFCEVLQGIRDDRALTAIQQRLSLLPIHSTGGVGLAVSAARNYRFLRTRGITIRTTIDCLIATLCIEKDHSLLHRDRDFDPFEQHLGLKVVHPV
jgi:predicted nucleic acid-binding protein